MKSNFVAWLKALFFCIALVTMFPLAQKTARADNVTYTTSGSFNGGGNSITFVGATGTLTLKFFFNPLGLPPGTPVTLNAAPPGTSASFGEIETTTTGTGAGIPAGTTLTITINQTVPSIGTTSFTGNLFSTNIGPTAASADSKLTFNPVPSPVFSVPINGVFYTIQFPNPLSLVPPVICGVSGCGRTSIQGGIITTIPEPTSMFLFTTGLTGLVSLRRRWAKRR